MGRDSENVDMARKKIEARCINLSGYQSFLYHFMAQEYDFSKANIMAL